MSNLFRLTCLETPNTNRGVGLALLLETPSGRTWLYDGGCGYPSADGWELDFNAGRDIIAPLLADRRIAKLDGAIASHAHYDHFGGLLWLVDHVPIDVLVDSGFEFHGDSDAGYSKELSDYAALRERFRSRPNAYRAATAGEFLDIDDALEVEVIAPPRGFFSEPHPERRPAKDPAAHYLLNSNAMILKIRHGEVTFLLAGDIEKEDQVDLLLPSVPAGKLACNVLIAPGHGLHSAPGFAHATRPATTVVSLFPQWINSCSAMPVFGEVGSDVYVTGIDGRITVVSDGTTHTVTTSRVDAEGRLVSP